MTAGIHVAKSLPHYFSYLLKRPPQNCDLLHRNLSTQKPIKGFLHFK